ncbi:MAG: ABC transporter substrate-binding protein [Clostridiales bacterium]|nr:ABC transporter substrate-binding protein [Clostridiales bacterium]
MKKILIVIMVVAMLAVGCTSDNEAVYEVNNEVANNVVENGVNESEGSGDAPEELVERKTTFTDTLGREIVIESKPEKVICLYGSFADLWYEAGGELVGIIESSTLPQQTLDLPKVGKMSTPNIEAILSLEPDMVIIRAGYSKQEELLNILEASNIHVYAADYNSFDETMTTFKNFCYINENEAMYEEKSQPLIEGIKTLTDVENDFSYLLLFASSKSISAKDDNITAGIIDNMGGENIAANYSIADEESKQFSFEKILELDPTYIFVQTMGSVEDAKARLEEDVMSNPAWASLTAVQEGRFIYLPKELFLYKPNMKYLDAYQHISDILEGSN